MRVSETRKAEETEAHILSANREGRQSVFHAPTNFVHGPSFQIPYVMGQKRRREAPIGVARRTEVYEDLGHVDQSIRLKAARTLLTEFVPGASTDQLQEILRRLIRGLCSGRKAARLGFSVALTGMSLQRFLFSVCHSEHKNFKTPLLGGNLEPWAS